MIRIRTLVALALVAVPLAARADYPHGPGLAPMESPAYGPVEVCNQLLAAERKGDYDDVVARTSIYARQKISAFDRFLLRLARGRLSEARCVKVTEDHGDWVMVQIYAPNGHGAPMPFLKQEGVWRFDQQKWEELRHAGKAPKP